MPERILIAPLDWGIGHVSRSKQIVKAFEEKEVILAIPKSYQSYFSDYNVKFEFVRGYNIKYYKNISVQISLLLQVLKIVYVFIYEKRIAHRLAKKHNVDYIISDNRPFFRASSCSNIYVTHQLTILNRKLKKNRITTYFHKMLINRFNICWVPDTENNDIAGDLSKGKINIKKYYIGGLSRFYLTSVGNKMHKFDSVCILSGPKPSKNIFFNKIKKQWGSRPNTLVIGALDGINEFKKINSLTISSHLTDSLFAEILKGADTIISKSGYSTIMDLLLLEKSAIIIPQKGQSEQEYLAVFHKNNYLAISQFPCDINEITYKQNNLKTDSWFYLNKDTVANYLS